MEMKDREFNKKKMKMIYKMNKKEEIIKDKTVSQTKNINIKKIVKQGSIFGP